MPFTPDQPKSGFIPDQPEANPYVAKQQELEAKMQAEGYLDPVGQAAGGALHGAPLPNIREGIGSLVTGAKDAAGVVGAAMSKLPPEAVDAVGVVKPGLGRLIDLFRRFKPQGEVPNMPGLRTGVREIPAPESMPAIELGPRPPAPAPKASYMEPQVPKVELEPSSGPAPRTSYEKTPWEEPKTSVELDLPTALARLLGRK